MAKKTKGSMRRVSFWTTASQAPSAISLIIGFILIFGGVLFPSILAILVNLAGFILIFSGIIGIYLLGGANRK